MAVSMKNVDPAFHGVGQKAYLALPSISVCYFFFFMNLLQVVLNVIALKAMLFLAVILQW